MKQADELKSWLALRHVSGVGSKTFLKLLNVFEQPSAVFDASSDSLKKAGISTKLISAIQNCNNLDASKPDIEWLESSNNHHIITFQCTEYPSLLKQIDSPPPLLYVHGNYSLLRDPQLAIIGSRTPTQSGMTTAYDFAKHLGKSGLCITSGLALGIDGIAHEGALDAGAPTIAVIATGIDRVYPAKHRNLAHRIVEQGAIISDFPIGTQPKAENFPQRNRIISGLSHGTLVVEAALRSGSLITARLAMEQNREVFAIPGSIHNPLAKGCHQLIKQGVKLVETAQDIMEEMTHIIDLSQVEASQSSHEITAPDVQHNQAIEISHDQQKLLDSMGFDPVPIDQLVIRTKLSPEAISAMLLILELQNKVSSNGGGTYTRISSN